MNQLLNLTRISFTFFSLFFFSFKIRFIQRSKFQVHKYTKCKSILTEEKKELRKSKLKTILTCAMHSVHHFIRNHFIVVGQQTVPQKENKITTFLCQLSKFDYFVNLMIRQSEGIHGRSLITSSL